MLGSGYVDVLSATACTTGAGVACLGQFAVEPSLQAMGLGRQMITLIERRAEAAGAREIALDTAKPATHLVGWYTRLGYRSVEYAQ